MTVAAGKLRDRVTLVGPPDPEVTDSYGETTAGAAGTPIGSFWADVRPLAGRGAMAARQQRAESSHDITMRNIGVEITARHSLTWHSRWGDRSLEIASALYVQKDEEWVIVAVETPDG